MFAAESFDAGDHKAIHDAFLAKALSLHAVGDAEMKFIKEWLVHHIKGTDAKYVAALGGK